MESPLVDTVTSATRIDLRGTVNDAVAGGIGAPEPAVSVTNGATGRAVNATVSDRMFIAEHIALEVGANALTVTARDHLGNARTRNVTVTRIAVGTSRVTLLSGNRQRAALGSELAQPLTIAALQADGLPWANARVRFEVVRGSGSLSTQAGRPVLANGVAPARYLEATTDAHGVAQVWFTLGIEAQPAGQVVRASHPDSVEDVLFTATAERGAPARIALYGAMGTQYVATASQPLDALTVQVLDAAVNPSKHVPVRYTIEAGDALFTAASAMNGVVSADGRAITVHTDKDGLASVRPQTGMTAGTVRIRAQASPETPTPIDGAMFQLIVLPRSDGPTRFSGLVLDHSGVPLSGITLSIARTQLTRITDANGRFEFDQVPAGKIDLFVDGRAVRVTRGTTTYQYPALHFEAPVIAGQANQLPHPIYLPPVNLSQTRTVGGDQDVELTLPGQEGFVMTVKANSVTFPDGSRIGPITLAPVHADRLPMVPPGPNSRFAGIAWTIQPSGTRFDPPIEVRIPNVLGFRAGTSMDVVQWDHDLAAFIPMGRGTVDETGTQVITDPGSGISKAGWGGAAPPIPPAPGPTDNIVQNCPDPQCGECEVLTPGPTGCNVCSPRPAAKAGENACASKECGFAAISGACIAEYDKVVQYAALAVAIRPPLSPELDPALVEWEVSRGGEPKFHTGNVIDVQFARSADPHYLSTVFAYCPQTTDFDHDKSVAAGPACSEHEPTRVRVVEDSSLADQPDPGDYGTFRAIWEKLQIRPCISTERRWTHRAPVIRPHFDRDYIDFAESHTEILSPNSDEINGRNCDDVIDDFTPSIRRYGTRIAPYDRYIPTPIIKQHEEYHGVDYERKVATPMGEWIQRELQALSGTECYVPKPQDEWREKFKDHYVELNDAWTDNGAHEKTAYDEEENVLLAEWVGKIRERAAREEWNEACR